MSLAVRSLAAALNTKSIFVVVAPLPFAGHALKALPVMTRRCSLLKLNKNKNF
jgi:hypothetical protein